MTPIKGQYLKERLAFEWPSRELRLTLKSKEKTVQVDQEQKAVTSAHRKPA